MQWAENRAGKGKAPELSPFRPLIKAGPPIEYGRLLAEADLTGPTHSSRVWVDDVNSDGKLDILVGDSVTLIAPVKGLSREDFKQKFSDWQNAFEAASAALSTANRDAKVQAKASEEYRKVYSRRAEFMIEEMTGFVWLYLQK